ncbi:MAG: diversity-generating retroelement protein Avd [Gammaproteobacteria bacterium]|jgi:hypothetical protein|nr:diversity-generating retroelement protein Avd [Gammaproteobacteria bacterium]
MAAHRKRVPQDIPQAVESAHELLGWIIQQLDKFPRNRRFTLGERLEHALIETLELLVEAAYSRNKRTPLNRANLRLEIVRHLWRLSHELRLISTKRYATGSAQIDNLGRQIGGWLRSRPQPKASTEA